MNFKRNICSNMLENEPYTSKSGIAIINFYFSNPDSEFNKKVTIDFVTLHSKVSCDFVLFVQLIYQCFLYLYVLIRPTFFSPKL